MYSSAGYGSITPPTNNPFVNDASNANTRFPDISTTLSSQPQSYPAGQYSSSQIQSAAAVAGYQAQPAQMGMYQPQPYVQPAFDSGPAGYALGAQPGYVALAPNQQQLQLQLQQQQQQQQQQQTPIYSSSSQQFQPTSSFGQQLVGQVNGSGYGYLQGQGRAGGGGTSGFETTTFSAAQQQIRNNPGYIAQFDPYASIGQGWDGQIQSQNQLQPQPQPQPQQLQQPQSFAGQPGSSFSPLPPSSSSSSSSSSPNPHPHPRDYIRAHKPELESWDTYAWKQLFNTFDALKDAWGGRKQELQANMTQYQAMMQYGGYVGQIQQELGRIQSLLKDAESNTDSVAASLFQMREVYAGYRHSGDLASKRRVRESCNAAVQSLPEWPQAF